MRCGVTVSMNSAQKGALQKVMILKGVFHILGANHGRTADHICTDAFEIRWFFIQRRNNLTVARHAISLLPTLFAIAIGGGVVADGGFGF